MLRNIPMPFFFATSCSVIINILTHKSTCIYLDMLTYVAKLFCIKMIQIQVLTNPLCQLPRSLAQHIFNVISTAHIQSVHGEARAYNTNLRKEKNFQLLNNFILDLEEEQKLIRATWEKVIQSYWDIQRIDEEIITGA